MKFNYLSGQERPYSYLFDPGWEVRAINAAYSELVTNKLTKSLTDRITTQEAYLASLKPDTPGLTRTLARPESMTNRLEVFYLDTDEAAIQIYSQSVEPDYVVGRYIAKRIYNGLNAKRLANSMLEAAARYEMEREFAWRAMSPDEQVAQMMHDIPEVHQDIHHE